MGVGKGALWRFCFYHAEHTTNAHCEQTVFEARQIIGIGSEIIVLVEIVVFPLPPFPPAWRVEHVTGPVSTRRGSWT
jgi:hypothetical protein